MLNAFTKLKNNIKSCLIHSVDEPATETWTQEMNGGHGELNSSPTVEIIL